MKLKKEHAPYVPSSATDVVTTFLRHGWTLPSNDPAIIDKWSYYKSIPQLSEAAANESSR
jgi:hypothetical protein